MRKAFITGITGQDGAWLAKLLIEKGYKVYGGTRKTSEFNAWRLDFLNIREQIELIEFDLLDYSNIFNGIKSIRPDEFYNLAAQSFVGSSFTQPISTGMINGMGVAYILDAIHTLSPTTKFYQASTSEIYGLVQETPQTEKTPFYPRSPYGCAKLYAHWMTVNYRESYNLFATSGILFNHESELRGTEFVTRKITLHVAGCSLGKNTVLELGNLNSERDWGYAKEYVEAMHLMLQAEKPDTFVMATGVKTKIRDFVAMAFRVIGKEIRFEGSGENEKGYDIKTGELLVRVNPKFYRPTEVETLIGDSSKARQLLGWKPKTSVNQLAAIMVNSDIHFLKKEH
jgi:GDPmannose 4,6-dehydratase